MSKRKKWVNNTNRLFFLIICIFMIVVTGAVGVHLTVRSVREMKSVRWNHMESVSNMAAMLIDGDEVEKITEADAPILDPDTGRRIQDGSERSCKIEKILLEVKAAQKDMQIPYIYLVRYNSEGKLVFIVDPELETPAAYGQEVVSTPSQPIAWTGQSKVDDEPYSDEWGEYYTAWSPVKNSAGQVVALVGVDFEASEISEQISFSIMMIVISTVVLLILCITCFLLYSMNEQRRAQQLGSEIADLSDNLKTMFDEIEGIQTTAETDEKSAEHNDEDFVKYIHKKTRAMTKRLREHTDYMMQQANV
ncbi:MAG: hypothetical protein J5781_07120, partial [Clostridia bacterium]|nr:hypothetical protein [Clostridia bacterium]